MSKHYAEDNTSTGAEFLTWVINGSMAEKSTQFLEDFSKMQFNLSVLAECENCSADYSKRHWSYAVSLSSKPKKQVAFQNFVFCYRLYSQRTMICLKK